jgi:hypothetical protein
MRKNIFVIFFCLFVLIIFSVVSYAANEAGQVLTVKKKVYMVRDNQKQDAEPRMALFQKDAVETDRKSRTKLFFNDDSILNLGELSRVEIQEYLHSDQKKRSKSIYRLIDGSLKVVVGRSDLEIHTPTAVAAARGTKFIIWAERGRSCAMVSEGEVVMSSNNKDITDTVSVRSCADQSKRDEEVFGQHGCCRQRGYGYE